MDDNFKKCPFCGKELPLEQMFCPYCVHRLDVYENKKEEFVNNKKTKWPIILIGIAVLGIVLFLTVVMCNIFIGGHQKQESQKSDSMNDYAYGMLYNTMSQIESDSTYTKEQKMAIEYYDNNYMKLFSYEFLLRYPDIFENSQVKFNAVVKKVVNIDKETFMLLVKWDETYEGTTQSNLDSYIMLCGKIEDISVAGNISDGTRVVEGDHIYVYAQLLSLENYTVDQTTYNIPKCNVNQIILNDSNTQLNERYNKEYLTSYARNLFGTEVSLREAEYGKDFIFDSLHYPEYKFLICELPNTLDSRFKSFEIYQQGGCIRQSGSTKEDDTVIRVAADGEHFYRIEHNKTDRQIEIAYYESVDNIVWSRKIENISIARYDFTVNNMYIASDDTLYIINNENGKDVYNPIPIEYSNGLLKCYDGIVLYVNDKGTFEKYDLKGNLVWKTNVVEDKFAVSNIQVTDEKLTIHLYAGSQWEDIIVVIRLDNGEILNSVHSLYKK